METAHLLATIQGDCLKVSYWMFGGEVYRMVGDALFFDHYGLPLAARKTGDLSNCEQFQALIRVTIC